MNNFYLHLNLDTKHTLPKHDVPDGIVNEVIYGLTGVNHESVSEFHGLGTGGAELSRNDNFATFRTGLHDKSEDTIASSAALASASSQV